MNSSGMHHVAMGFAEAERRLGHDSTVMNIDDSTEWDSALDADIHVSHTHFPEAIRFKITQKHRVVFVGHGTPEHVMEGAIDASVRPGYGPPDGWMLLREWLREADAVVTFWPRHQSFYQSMVPHARTIDCVPMGVDVEFWKQGVDKGRYAGSPSVWMSENQHNMKWALDAFTAWPLITKAVPQARLHANYIPTNLHRFFVDYANTNGAAYRSYISSNTYPHESLRDLWKSFDFFWGPVRYGDHNYLFMQAAAAGVKTITYRGNPYADFWITEGDQREMARELIAIFRGEAAPREKAPIPDLLDMGRSLVAIYERILGQPSPNDDRLAQVSSARVYTTQELLESGRLPASIVARMNGDGPHHGLADVIPAVT